MPTLSTWILATRPKTLFAAAAPVLIGTAMALESGGAHWPSAILCLAGAVLIQVGTNLHNDVADFEKGVDTNERKGPLRVTAAGLVSPAHMKVATAASFALSVVAGAYLMWRGGWPIILIGILSIALGLLYSAGRFSLSSTGLADVAVFVFFGPVAVAGTYYVQTLTMSPVVLLAGLGPGLLSVAILLVNNVRDVDEDREAGKHTLVVRLGRRWGVRLYLMCIVVATAVPIALGIQRPDNIWVVISVLALPPLFAVWRTIGHVSDGPRLNPLLARTSRMLMLYSVLFSIGWNL